MGLVGLIFGTFLATKTFINNHIIRSNMSNITEQKNNISLCENKKTIYGISVLLCVIPIALASFYVQNGDIEYQFNSLYLLIPSMAVSIAISVYAFKPRLNYKKTYSVLALALIIPYITAIGMMDYSVTSLEDVDDSIPDIRWEDNAMFALMGTGAWMAACTVIMANRHWEEKGDDKNKSNLPFSLMLAFTLQVPFIIVTFLLSFGLRTAHPDHIIIGSIVWVTITILSIYSIICAKCQKIDQ